MTALPAETDPAVLGVARLLWGQSVPHLKPPALSQAWEWMAPVHRKVWLAKAAVIVALVDEARRG